MLTAQFITTEEELVQVAQLSAGNLVSNISAETKAKEGFVSWSYPLATLQLLHSIQPSVIVKDNTLVAGYALVLTPECIPYYPPLAAVIAHMQSIRYKDRPLTDLRTYLMGQICVHPDYRGKGVVDRLYQFHRQALSLRFDCCVTEISTSNIRSLKAHLKTGFCIIDTYRDEQDEWDVVLWDWSSGQG
jgi:ribosomal protein S18 acetylase RimI-like enzyme